MNVTGYELKIVLLGTKPSIERKMIVPANITFYLFGCKSRSFI